MTIEQLLDKAFEEITGLESNLNDLKCAYCKSTIAPQDGILKGTKQVLRFCNASCSGGYLSDYGSLSFYGLEFPGPTLKTGQYDWPALRSKLLKNYSEVGLP